MIRPLIIFIFYSKTLKNFTMIVSLQSTFTIGLEFLWKCQNL